MSSLAFFPSIMEPVVEKLIIPVFLYAGAATYLHLKRYGLCKFYGLLKGKNVLIITSNLYRKNLDPKNKKGLDVLEQSILSGTEFEAVCVLQQLFGWNYSFGDNVLAHWAHTITLQSKVRCDIEVSPVERPKTDTFHNCFIIIGSSVFNVIRDFFVKSKNATAYFLKEDIQAPGTKKCIENKVIFTCGVIVEPISDEEELCIIEKNVTGSKTYFYISGFSGFASSMGANFLVKTWPTLQKIYRSDPFTLCLRINKHSYSIAYLTPSKYLFEF